MGSLFRMTGQCDVVERTLKLMSRSLSLVKSMTTAFVFLSTVNSATSKSTLMESKRKSYITFSYRFLFLTCATSLYNPIFLGH